MKARKQINGSYFTLLIVSVLVVALVAFSSCGKANEPVAANTELPAPTPPPPVPANPDSVYVEVDELPVYTGGESALLKYIADNTVYPAGAKTNKIQGKVIVRLVVEKDGSVSNVAVLKSVNPLLDAEAVRVVSSLPKFESPAKKDGSAVRIHYMVPIAFALK